MSGCLLIGIRLKINRRLPAAADRCLRIAAGKVNCKAD